MLSLNRTLSSTDDPKHCEMLRWSGQYEMPTNHTVFGLRSQCKKPHVFIRVTSDEDFYSHLDIKSFKKVKKKNTIVIFSLLPFYLAIILKGQIVITLVQWNSHGHLTKCQILALSFGYTRPSKLNSSEICHILWWIHFGY